VDVNHLTARLLRRYWIVLLAAVAVSVAAAGGLVLTQDPSYTAHARIAATASTPRAQAEAAAVASQVRAIATSRDVIVAALEEAKLKRDPDKIVDQDKIVVTGLGSSGLVDLAYTDADPEVAQKLTAALARLVTTKLDAIRIGGLPDVLKDVDNQLTELATKRAAIAAEAQANPRDPVAQNRLAGIDRLISDLSGDRNRLSEDAAAAGHATVVETPTKPSRPDPRGLPFKLGIALILGLTIAMIVIGANETVRPTVSGALRVGRLLDVHRRPGPRHPGTRHT
jgi:uncharacterized protein involved in exopolysaccharide biosynthesis